MSVNGLDRHLRRLIRMRTDIVRVAGAVVYEGADMIRAEAHNSITRGAVSGAGHVPSAPGQPPNEDTGFLRGAIINEPTGPLTAEVGALAPYSAALEFGSSRVAARPFMRPARDKMRPQIEERMARQMNRLIRRSGN